MTDKETYSSSTNPTDKIYGIANIKSYIPPLLDLDRLTYNSCKELFKTYCRAYFVYNHLDGFSCNPGDPVWDTTDNVVK